MSNNRDIEIEFDDVSKDYYVVWEPPVAIGSGGTDIEALHDLREVAHFGVDSLIDLKIKEITKEE